MKSTLWFQGQVRVLSSIWSKKKENNSSHPSHDTAVTPNGKQIKCTLTFWSSSICSNLTTILSNSCTRTLKIIHYTNWLSDNMMAEGKHFSSLPVPCPQSPFLACSVPPFPNTACAIYFLTQKWFNAPLRFLLYLGSS